MKDYNEVGRNATTCLSLLNERLVVDMGSWNLEVGAIKCKAHNLYMCNSLCIILSIYTAPVRGVLRMHKQIAPLTASFVIFRNIFVWIVL